MHLYDDCACKDTAAAKNEQQLKNNIQQARSEVAGLTIEHRCCTKLITA